MLRWMKKEITMGTMTREKDDVSNHIKLPRIILPLSGREDYVLTYINVNNRFFDSLTIEGDGMGGAAGEPWFPCLSFRASRSRYINKIFMSWFSWGWGFALSRFVSPCLWDRQKPSSTAVKPQLNTEAQWPGNALSMLHLLGVQVGWEESPLSPRGNN